MSKYHDPFEPNYFFHIYNRGNNKENIFREWENYEFFLGKWRKYLFDFVEVWAYCLMPNHFHFLIRVKEDKRLPKYQRLGKSYSKILSNQFRNLFISYAKSFNKVYKRTGSLFQKQFNHLKIDTEDYLFILIHYIHHNPIHHHFVKDYADWKYSSYTKIMDKSDTIVNKNAVLELFGGKKQFLEIHQQSRNYKEIDHVVIE